MSALLTKLSVALFAVSIVGAVIGIVMAKLLAPSSVEQHEQEQSDERCEKRHH